MATRARTRRKSDGVERKPKKRVSILDSEQITYVDYKDVNLLRRFMSERAKIRARRVTGNDTQQQREIAKAIRLAREMALLPYSVRQVTHRSKGKRDRGDRDDAPLSADAVEARPAYTGIDVEADAEAAAETAEVETVFVADGDGEVTE
jgi:small subunit ribosomal protein S18